MLTEARCPAAWLAVGLWVLLLPPSVGTRPLSAAAAPAAAFFLLWLMVGYVASALVALLDMPALARAIGVYVFPEAPEAMTHLGLQLAVAAALGGLARSRLPLDNR